MDLSRLSGETRECRINRANGMSDIEGSEADYRNDEGRSE
jgi:hypothetical protein